jgi:hypothetical protein
MKNNIFNEKQKIEAFDKIAENFYYKNFGQMSKSDVELLMFNIYTKCLVEKSKLQDGTINYSKCSDYKISQELGITQQKVRNLKIKCQLKYPIEFDWKTELAKLIKNARYDKVTRKISVNIPDPNLFLEIQNFVEEKGAFIEIQLNSKILQLRAEYFIQLVVELEEEKTKRNIVNSLKKQIKESNKDDSMFDENNLGKSLLETTVNITSIASNISSLISPQNFIGKAVFELLKNNC